MSEGKLPTNVARLYPPPEAQGESDHWRVPLPARNDPSGTRSPSEAEKEARRAEKRRRELSEPVEPWERYRALRQTLDEAQKFEDLADHKARFAMILMGALNADFVVLALSDASGGLSFFAEPQQAGYLALCGAAALYLFHQAIEALRPRSQGRRTPTSGDSGAEATIGLRHHDDVLRRSHEAYLAAWQQVGVEQLSREIALQVHRQAQVNRDKEKALTRLYAGLRTMMLLLVGLTIILATAAGRSSRPASDSGKPGKTAVQFYKVQPGHAARAHVRSLVGS